MKWSQQCRLLNRGFYLKKLRAIAKVGAAPWSYYTRERRQKNRRASLGIWLMTPYYWLFDRKYYLKANLDVAKEGLDPWFHYVTYGKQEGRSINSIDNINRQILSATKILTYKLNLDSNLFAENGPSISNNFIMRLAKDGEILSLMILKIKFLFFNLLSKNNYFFKILKINDISKNKNIKKMIIESNLFYFQDPIVLGRKQVPHTYCIKVPEQFIAKVSNASITDRFIVMKRNQFILYEPAADPRHDSVAGQWQTAKGIKDSDNVLVIAKYENEVFIDEAILISGRCSPNYFHTLIEYFGKSYLVNRISELKNIQIIVDSEIYPQQIEVLKILFPSNPILFFHPKSLLRVRKLHIPSIGTYLPDTLNSPLWKGAAVSYPILNYIRSKVFLAYGIPLNKEISSSNRKIYLTRKKRRGILNNDDVEKFLENLGYEIVDTGEISFHEQVLLFSSASEIVSPNGAALSNLIFASEGCKVLSLNSPFTVMFPMFASLAKFSKCEFFVLGGTHDAYHEGDENDPQKIPGEIFFDNYGINLEELEKALELINKPRVS
jgi:hypothetical protein